MGSIVDRTGQVFGRLIVLKRVDDKDHKRPLWLCQCICGNTVATRGQSLRSGVTKSCGCLQPEIASKLAKKTKYIHGLSPNGHPALEYKMFHNAKVRAKRGNFPFALELSDIVIPEFCPVFPDLRLVRDNTHPQLNSPSLDKLIPSLGYVKGNVRVISYKANTIKQRATFQELLQVAEWLRKEVENVATQGTTRGMSECHRD